MCKKGKNVISKTGQSWKIKLTFIILGLSGVSMFYANYNAEVLSKYQAMYFHLGGVFFGIASFFFSCISIKCPSCGSRWFLSAVSGKSNKQWLFWLNSLKSCPECGEPKDAV